MSKFYFSMVVYVDDDTMLNKSIRSIYKVDKKIHELVKLIIVDSICSETSIETYEKWKSKLGKKNVCYIDANGLPVEAAYNLAMTEIRGKYVNFTLASNWFDAGILEAITKIADMCNEPKLISLAPWTVNEKDEVVQYRMSPIAQNSNDYYRKIKLYREPEQLQLMFHAYFIRTFLFYDRGETNLFKEELHNDALIEKLLELLAEWRGYVYLPLIKLNYTVQMEDNTSTFMHQYDEWWYNDSFKNWMKPFVENLASKSWPIEKFIRVAMLYLVFARYNCNYNDRNKGVIKGEKLQEFVQLTGDILQYVDSDRILRKKNDHLFAIPRSVRFLFMKIRAESANCESKIVTMGRSFYFFAHKKNMDYSKDAINISNNNIFPDINNDANTFIHSYSLLSMNETGIVPKVTMQYENDNLSYIGDIDKEQVILKVVNYKDGMLEIDGTFSGGDFLEKDNIKVVVASEEREIEVEFSEVYGLNKEFGVTYNHKYNFKVSIPAHPFIGKENYQFYIELAEEKRVPLRIRSGAVYSHLIENIYGQYWGYTDGWGANIANKTILRIYRLSDEDDKEKVFQNELMKRSKNGDEYAEQALSIRKKYFEKIKENRNIWITFDKLYKAGDNGEYIYDYISENHKYIDMRYLIKEDSPDYTRMLEKGDNLLVWGQEDTIVDVLCARVILTTHTNVVSYCGIEKPLIPYLCDLFNPINVCIQHGLTTQNIAQFQNRLFDNLQLYLCASPNEIQNLERPIYGFEDEMLKLTGVARYDGLKSNDQKQILITPTWRRNIANANVAHVKKGHNEFFKNSEYFRIYNSLINDEKLINEAKKYGYKIIYLLHPAVSSQLEDFDRNDYVEIIPAASDMNYEKILTESSLMVTDYSGVQFDFAYQRKPLLYYHPAALPPHYDQSKAYQYDKDAFGPIIDNHQEMVEQLCEYMKNGCKMKPEYAERADKFFAYDDFGNCPRIFNEIYNLYCENY